MSFQLTHNPGRAFTFEETEYLYFGGTSYLGLQTNQEFLKRYAENILSYGSSHGASRNSNIQLSIYDKTEEVLANFTGSETCLTTSSGFMAGQIVRNYLGSGGYKLFHFPGSHAALRNHTDYKFETLEDLKISILNFLEKETRQIPVLFFDSISFNTDHFPDFEFLKKLPLDKLFLVADDSHGIGVVGESGSGSYAALKALGAKNLIVCGSLAKALATPAGFILGDKLLLEEIRQGSVFAGASPANPASIATLAHSLKQVSLQHKLLKANVTYLLNQLKKTDFLEFNPGHAGFNYKDQHLVNYLKSHHILVTDFEYAGGGANRLTRIVLSAQHTKKDIDTLVDHIHRYFNL